MPPASGLSLACRPWGPLPLPFRPGFLGPALLCPLPQALPFSLSSPLPPPLVDLSSACDLWPLTPLSTNAGDPLQAPGSTADQLCNQRQVTEPFCVLHPCEGEMAAACGSLIK